MMGYTLRKTTMGDCPCNERQLVAVVAVDRSFCRIFSSGFHIGNFINRHLERHHCHSGLPADPNRRQVFIRFQVSTNIRTETDNSSKNGVGSAK